ncbi:MAG TPA: PfkB family carbohydrate kinase [Caulobacteraceae bacterium]|nr:PfkB family carbohydrate kinase [Caulobacteraceae bacterium]
MRVLILSSFVAASRVGGSAQLLALARLGIEPVLAPTVLFGRHPGHGPPGGAAVAAETFEGVLAGIEAQGLYEALDAVITGYFAMPEQVAVAADALTRIKAAGPATRIVVDPIIGDADKGLYVREAVAVAIADHLIPRADLVTPNAWELTHVTGRRATDAPSAAAAAAKLGRPALISSVPAGGDIGVLYADGGKGWLASHAPSPAAPKGTGDLLAAFMAAALVQGRAPSDALEVAVGSLAELIAASGADDAPLASLPTTLTASARVRLETVGG